MSSELYSTVDDALLCPPKVSCRDARRQSIVAIAREMFLKEGFAAASMSAIAAQVGGSKATLYNYFSSKEQLFQAVIEAYCERAHAVLFESLAEGDDFTSVLRELCERYVQLMTSETVISLHRLVVAECVRFPNIGRTLYDAGPRVGRQRLSTYIKAAMDKGWLRAEDPATAAEQLIDLAMASQYRLRLLNVAGRPNAAEIAAAVDRAMRTFMAAFAVERPSRPG